jgi:PAB-dependent poly(A)-specific ribonuclease subunit 2
VDFVGYAPNPHFSRGGVKGEAYRRAAPLRNKRAESREAAALAKRKAATKAKLSTQVGDVRGAAATSPLPPLYHRVEVRLSANRARFEEFDFSEHNRTRLVGLVNDLANSYVNPVLQMLHFTPELRAEVLMGHSCEREFCLTCELGFLSHMLAQPPTRGAGSHSSSSATAQPLNFLRTLRQVREAAALGLIEGRDELETRLDQSKPRRVQAFQRFILEQLHKEDANGSASSLPANAKTKSSSGTAEKTETGCVERLFALVSTQTHTCAQCNRVEKRSSRSFQTDLQYPEKKTWRKGSPSNPTFAECLAKSLCASQEVRAWCDGHGAYTRMAQRKVPKRLPQVLSVNLGMRDPGDLRWWGVDVDSHVLSAAAKAPVEKHWLPQYVRVAVDEEGAGANPGGEGSVRVAQAADDVDALDGDGVTYELTSLVCLARRPAEEDDDDSPGGGLDETGAKKLAGHLLSFVKVTPPYVRARGRFDAAPSPPEGESPGVSPLPNAAAAARAGAAAADETVSETVTGSEDPPATPGPAAASGDGDAPGSATASEKKAAGFAAALAAGEAMYGENSGFQGLTPSRVEASPHLDTDWLLFNDFCITPVPAKEVTRLYGQAKLPTLCAYTRVDRPTPKPLPPSPITADVYRRLTLDANLPPRSPFAPFDYESPKETPGVGTLLGIDAEFVSLAPAVKEPGPEGEEIVVQPVRLGLARVSVVRGDPDHPKRLVPVIDDYIRAVEPVHDYLTRFSGLVPGDLDPVTSKRHIVKLKHAYLKLRYLIDAGCIFVGHGLKQDFKMINVVVPPAQIVDTVELFHFKRQRKLSLRFLASYLLGADIQKDTHDSIEDARTAVRLYEKYLEMRRDGEGAFREKLLEIYRFGKQHGFTGEVRPDNVAPPPPPGPPPAPPPPPGPPPPSAVPQPRET